MTTTLLVLTLTCQAPPADPGADVLAVFAAKCAGCHATKPVKGNFGFVLDLPRLAADREKVVPGDAAASDLWKLVNSGNMPPNTSPGGPLSAVQKGIIYAWIAAGAPAAASVGVNSNTTPAPPVPLIPVPGPASPADSPAAVVPAPSFFSRALDWLGNLHLLMLHFPIALAYGAAGAEGWSMYAAKKTAGPLVPHTATTWPLVIAALASVPVAVTGWLHAASGYGAAQPDVLLWHRWLGVVSAASLVWTARWALQDALLGTRQVKTRVSHAVALGLVTATAHLGGTLTHGPGFLTF